MPVHFQLSPAAQIVMDGWWNDTRSNQEGIAAVLRALTKSGLDRETMIDGWVCKAIDVETILNLAAELEAK
jgi:hypothetical protein